MCDSRFLAGSEDKLVLFLAPHDKPNDQSDPQGNADHTPWVMLCVIHSSTCGLPRNIANDSLLLRQRFSTFFKPLHEALAQ